MKHGWIVLLFTACVVRVSSPFHLPPPDPDTEPAPGRTSEPPGLQTSEPAPPRARHRTSDQKSQDAHRMWAGTNYDEVIGLIADGDRAAAEHKEDWAANRYRAAVDVADELIGDVERDQDLAATYSTKTDGRIDRPTLLARTREHRAHAAQLADRAQERYTAALVAEFHPTPDQRKVLLELGRPEVAHQRGRTCWVYRDDSVLNTYCWTQAGRLAEHTTVDTLAEQRARILYYAATTLASGSCRGAGCDRSGWTTPLPGGKSADTSCRGAGCLQSGWTTRFPDGQSADTSCRGAGCLQSGWTTRFPDGQSADTSCRGAGCDKSGWTTRFPDGQSADTSCRGAGCFQSGWTTRLPDGGSISCDCSGSGCMTSGARCQ
jgi:hypothetical protein